MLKWGHVINDLGSGPKTRDFDEPSSAFVKDWKDQRAGSADHRQPFYLADRGEVLKGIFENGAKTGPQAEEKKGLISNRNTAIILFPTKGAVL